MPPQAYPASQHVVPRRGIFLGKWRNSFTGISEGEIKSDLSVVQSLASCYN
jgi:hypothetical protein